MNILLLEDSETRHEWFVHECAKLEPAQLVIAKNVSTAIETLAAQEYDVVFLDHDLHAEHYDPRFFGHPSETSGLAVAKWLAIHPDRSPKAAIIVHSMNQVGAARMIVELFDAGRRVWHIPFPALQAQGLRRALSLE